MVRAKYVPDTKFYNEYYSQHGGSANLPVFSGRVIQKGYGLGGLIAGLARSVIPILTKNVTPLMSRGIKYAMPLVKKGAKDIGKHVLSSGVKEIADVLNNKTTAKSAMTRQKKEMKRKLAEVITDTPRSKRKRKSKQRKKTNTTKDIFT